jgi:hypothetical protein
MPKLFPNIILNEESRPKKGRLSEKKLKKGILILIGGACNLSADSLVRYSVLAQQVFGSGFISRIK